MPNQDIIISFDSILQAAINHSLALVLTFVLLVFWFKRDALINGIKIYFDARNVALDRKTDELIKINERYFSLYENSSRALERVSEAIVSFKEGLFMVEARLTSKIDQEMEEIREEIRNNKIDQLTLVLNKERDKSNPNFTLEARRLYTNEFDLKTAGAKKDVLSNPAKPNI